MRKNDEFVGITHGQREQPKEKWLNWREQERVSEVGPSLFKPTFYWIKRVFQSRTFRRKSAFINDLFRSFFNWLSLDLQRTVILLSVLNRIKRSPLIISINNNITMFLFKTLRFHMKFVCKKHFYHKFYYDSNE